MLKYVLTISGAGMFLAAAAVIFFDTYMRIRSLQAGEALAPVRASLAARLAAMGCIPLLLGLSIVVVPGGMMGIRVSQISGPLPGALYPGSHWIFPLVHQVDLYTLREQIFSTSAADDPKKEIHALKVQTREGLEVGLAVAVRYRLDPARLDYIHASLPQPVELELVPPVVASVFREVVPGYLVKEVFSTRREEFRRTSAEAIQRRLAADGIIVREVVVRDVRLPVEYANGLEGLLIKEQENERLAIELEVKQKQVRTAELEAEAEKARQVKQAEAQAQVVVLQAKAQADAMQYTLPLKEKQIQQTRLEAEARKESVVKNAEAAAQAKVIDGKAELERLNLMAEAEDHRIRLVSAANAERLKMEALVLKDNPLLIQKIIAERLSDKVQIMMVPNDGKFFFANDVLRGPALDPHPNEK